MIRLERLLCGYKNSETSFLRMYEGPMCVHYRDEQWGDSHALYYDGEVGYLIERSGRIEGTKPTVTVRIPMEMILGGDSMKRLRYYFTKMDNDTATYRYRSERDPAGHQKSIYDGEAIVHFEPKSNGESREPELCSMPRFFEGEVGYTLAGSGKLRQDCPTVTAEIPVELLGISPENEHVTTAIADCLLREFYKFIKPLNDELYNRSRPDTENGRYYVYEPGGEVLLRNAAFFAELPRKDYRNGGGINVYILPENELRPPSLHFCVRMQVQLPKGKLRRAISMLCSDLPRAVADFIAGFDRERVARAAALAERQHAIRVWLKESEYCAFLANGSILPRAGESELPKPGALPFKAVRADEIEVAGARGMGIRRGVTVITGGGYSGKSTLLDAIAAGIYDHAEGDGRELVITDESAVSIAAEDGRSVKHADISPFLGWLPMGGDTADFSTAHASGSTSQAANIVEAAACGCRLMLIDEDRSATNFMIRDDKMKRLIEREPITPLTDRVRELARDGISTILVIGGSGEYLAVADRVYMMDDFVISDATDRAKELAGAAAEAPPKPLSRTARRIPAGGFTSYPEGSGTERLEYSATRFITIGDEYIDTRALHEVITHAQANAMALILRQLMISNSDAVIDIAARVDELYAQIKKDGLDTVWSARFDAVDRFLDLPRKCDVLAAIWRMRGI